LNPGPIESSAASESLAVGSLQVLQAVRVSITTLKGSESSCQCNRQ
jgi:hypothetical protein